MIYFKNWEHVKTIFTKQLPRLKICDQTPLFKDMLNTWKPQLFKGNNLCSENQQKVTGILYFIIKKKERKKKGPKPALFYTANNAE